MSASPFSAWFLPSSLLAYFAIGRQEKGAWIRFGLYGAAMMICAASIWMEIVRPVLAAPILLVPGQLADASERL